MTDPRTRYKPFLDEIQRAAGRYRQADMLGDACHMMACSIWSALCFGERRKAVEAEGGAE